MAADADTPEGEGELSATAASPASSDHTEEHSPASREEVEPVAAQPEAVEEGAEQVEDFDAVVDDDVDTSTDIEPEQRRTAHVRLATMVGVVAVAALAALVGWLGFRAYESHQAQAQRQLLVQVARQGALNLTTIDWQHADGDVQRVLDSATGKFYDQFAPRKQSFIDVVKKSQSKSVGTITEAGLESDSRDQAEVLVIASVKISNLGAAEQRPREWRMRISVEKSGGEAKVSNVAFVP